MKFPLRLLILLVATTALPQNLAVAQAQADGLPVASDRVTDLPPEIAKWESAIEKLEARDREEGISGDRIVYYGSSSIRLWHSIADDMAPWPAVERGYGGAKLPDIIHYAPRVIGPYLGGSNPNRCRAVVLFVANDISAGNSDADPQQVANRFAKLLAWIRDQDATVPLFWIEVTPTRSRWKVWPQIEDATHRIRQIAIRDGNTHLISTAGAFLGIDGKPRPELFIRDQLHLNADGYKQWAILIKARLHEVLGATPPQVSTEDTVAPGEPS